MAWYKTAYDSGFRYGLSAGTDRVIHRCVDLTDADLKDPTRQFLLHSHSYFIEECVKVAKKETVTLPSGVYYVTCADRSDCTLDPLIPKKDRTLFTFSLNKDIIQDFLTFINAKEVYKQLDDMVYKKGILLYGPPGTGKTSLIQLLIDQYQPKDSLVLYLREPPAFRLIEELEKDPRLKIIIFEELLSVVRDDFDALLRFLDGEISVSNAYIIASTNYPEKLPNNLTNRQGRFDKLYKIEFLSVDDKQRYFQHHLHRALTDQELDLTRDMSIVQIKEILLLIIRDKLSFEAACKTVRDHAELVKTNFLKKIEDKHLDDNIL